jgi:hypothetical protein
MNRIDPKSLMIGFLTALSLYLLLGQAAAAPSQVGRYQLVAIPGALYVMDTTQRDAIYSLGIVNASTYKMKKQSLVEAPNPADNANAVK